MHQIHAKQRFIIERPRLIQLLDSLDARIILLTAPAGYGKSTLARQWAAKRGNILWYEASAASRDVASLAMGLAASCAVSPDALTGLRSQVDALAKPDESASHLGGALADTLRSDVVDHAVVAVDEIDILSSSTSSAEFLKSLVEGCDRRFLLIGRQRPHWASTRKILYGEIAELGREQLSFTEAEAEEVLTKQASIDPNSLWARARGWPAVIRLAALSEAGDMPSDVVGPALHTYLAEELYDKASESLQAKLPLLALLPDLSNGVLALVFGSAFEKLRDEAVDLGFLSSPNQGELDLHPLLRDFVKVKFDADRDREACANLLQPLLDNHLWDNAFSLLRQSKLSESLPTLIAAALDELLTTGRIRTLEDWLSFARTESILAPDIQLLEAELARRSGALTVARAHALHAAHAYRAQRHPWASRSYSLAGICAHLSQCLDEAVEHYEHARATATTRHDMRQAIWGQFVTSNARHDGLTRSLLDEFTKLADADPSARLRAAMAHFTIATREGAIETTLRDHVEPYLDLCDVVTDPLVMSSVYYQLSFAYIVTGRYRRGLEILSRGEEHVRAQKLSFARTHFAAARIAATLGLRRLRRAAGLLDELVELADATGDTYELPNASGFRARLLLCTGEWDEAARTLLDWENTPVQALRAELAALRSLALSMELDTGESEMLATRSLEMSNDAQAQTAARAALAIIDLRSGLAPEESRFTLFEETLVTRENYDGLVYAYRTYPPLLRHLIDRSRVPRRRIFELLADAHDTSLARSLGIAIPREARPTAQLSPREEEVFELMQQGRKNREIAAALFISPATVKVHVRHILEKLNARTRTEAVLRDQDARASATARSEADEPMSP